MCQITPNLYFFISLEMKSETERLIKKARDDIRTLKKFAREHEITLLAICLMQIKNRRKKLWQIGITGLAVFLLCLLHDDPVKGGAKKKVAELLSVSVETIRQWLSTAGAGTLEEIEEISKNRVRQILKGDAK